MTKFIAVIPARGGSKGIKNKNIISCAGRPLICWTIDACLECSMIEHTFVSTDSEDIAEISQRLGANIIKRPIEIAQDNSPSILAFQHAASCIDEANISFNGMVIAQPTSPLRNSKHLSEAIEKYVSLDCNSLVSVEKVPHKFAPKSLLLEEKGFLKSSDNQIVGTLNRHQKTQYFARNGAAIYIAAREHILSGNLLTDPCCSYEMGQAESIDIDSYEDLKLANFLLSNGWV